MMRANLIPIMVVICMVMSGVTVSQQKKPYLRPRPLNDGLSNNSIYIAKDNLHGWLCGELGKIQLTENGGQTWTDIRQNYTTASLRDIFFLDDNKTGWIVGARGTLLFSKNGGKSWNIIIGLYVWDNLNSIRFTQDGKNGIVVGDNGRLLISTDGGITWEKHSTGYYNDLYGAGFLGNGRHAYIYGAGNSFFMPNDSTFSKWKDKLAPYASSTDYATIQTASVNEKHKTIWAGGSTGYLLKSTDMGNKWVVTKLPTDEDINSIWFDPDIKNGWAVSSGGQIFQTTDGGSNWVVNFEIPRNEVQLNSVAFSADNRYGWVCGSGEVNILTTDSGRSWDYKPMIRSDLRKFYMSENGIELIIAGDKGNVIRSDDGLKTWRRISPQDVDTAFWAMSYDPANDLLWVAGAHNTIARCDGNGRNWEIVNSTRDHSSLLSILSLDNSRHIIAAGSNSTVLSSEDGGKSWKTEKLEHQDLTLRDISFLPDQRHGWIVGDYGHIYHTEDSGVHWNRSDFVDSTQLLIIIRFSPDHQTGYIVTTSNINDRHLYRSTDSGRTWKIVNNFPNNAGLEYIAFTRDGKEIVVAGMDGNVYKSVDGGNNWFTMAPKCTFQRLTNVNFDSDNNPTLIGEGGTILRPTVVENAAELKDVNIEETQENLQFDFLIDNESLLQSDAMLAASVEGSLVDYAAENYKVYKLPYDKRSSFQLWPRSVFKPNHKYTIWFMLFDGWNVTTVKKEYFSGVPFFSRLKSFMGWNKIPEDRGELAKIVGINLSALAFAYALCVILLFLFIPVKFVFWHEAVASSRLPFPEKLSKFLVLFLIEQDRSLNAFVDRYREKAVNLFAHNEEVKTRLNWVPAPFRINNRDIINFSSDHRPYTAGLTEISQELNNTRRIICIEGQGGVGKSTLAFQLAGWANESNPKRRLFSDIMLPIFINNLETDLDDACKAKLMYIIDSTFISDALLKALLKKKIIAIVDGLSEMPSLEKKYIDPEKGAQDIHTVIYTSRRPVSLPESTVIIPLGLKLSYLDNLIDGFTNVYVGAYKFSEQREILRSKIIHMVTEFNDSDPEKPVPLIILRLMIEKAAQLIEAGEELVGLPNSFQMLCEEYISAIIRDMMNIDAGAISLRKAAMISTNLVELVDPNIEDSDGEARFGMFKPSWVPREKYKQYIEEQHLDTFLASGVMMMSGSIGDKQMKFANDPIAEYLVAKDICIRCRDQILHPGVIGRLMQSCRDSNPTLHSLIRNLGIQMNVDFTKG